MLKLLRSVVFPGILALWRTAALAAGAVPPLTLPASERPAWLADEGLIMAGSWEPLVFRVRRDGGDGFTPTPEQRAGYEREHSPEMVAKLKELGVNFVMMHCYKGGGLELEHESMADAVRFARLCREAQLHVGVYAYSGALLWEPMVKEVPSAWEWFLLDEHGEPLRYYGLPYRYRWNRNHPGAMAFYKGIIRFAVQDIQADLIHLDNHSTGPGYDGTSQRLFGEYLAKTFSKAQLAAMDVTDPKKAMPPRSTDKNVMLGRAWDDFRAQALTDSYFEIGRYARSLRQDVLMELNPGGLGRHVRGAVDHGRLLAGGEAFWSEGTMRPWRGEGPLETNIAAYKFARRMGNMMFRYVTTPLQLAEAMAFNLDALGCLVAFEYGNLKDFPGEKGKPLTHDRDSFVRFFRTRRELFKRTEVVADTAVLRSYASQMFGPAERANTSAQVADELIASRAAFQIIADAHLADLSRYRVLVLADCLAMSDTEVRQVRDFVTANGRLCVIGPAATHDEWMQPRAQPAFDDLPADRVFHVAGPKNVPAAVERALGGSVALKIASQNGAAGDARDACFGLCAELTRRGDNEFVHLVNYRDGGAVENVPVRLRVAPSQRVRSVTLASPETRADSTTAFTQEGEFVTFTVPRVGIYTIAHVAAE